MFSKVRVCAAKRSNESPSGAFKRQNGLAQQDGGARPDKFAFAKRSGAMKAPVGLLSDRTVLRSKIPRTAPDNGALKAAAGEYENFSQKGLTFYPLCGIILEQSARAAEKQKSKYRGVEQSGSSSGS